MENDLDEILNEIKIMKQCRSPYIISYYGSYFKETELWVSAFRTFIIIEEGHSLIEWEERGRRGDVECQGIDLCLDRDGVLWGWFCV